MAQANDLDSNDVLLMATTNSDDILIKAAHTT